MAKALALLPLEASLASGRHRNSKMPSLLVPHHHSLVAVPPSEALSQEASLEDIFPGMDFSKDSSMLACWESQQASIEESLEESVQASKCNTWSE